MSDIFVIYVRDLKRLVYRDVDNYRWFFVGKNVSTREDIVCRLGKNNRQYLGNSLHEIAKKYRQPYLDFVARLGKIQKDGISWWASEFASRSPFLSDFFLLLCYKKLIIQHIEAWEKKRDFTYFIIVEDPWLYDDLKSMYRHHDAVHCFGEARLMMHKSFLFLRGLMMRIMLAVYLLAEKALLKLNGAKISFHENAAVERVVGLLSYAEDRAFKENMFTNPYLDELVTFLCEKGVSVRYVMNIRFPLRFAKKIAHSRFALVPLIHYVTFQDIGWSILKQWRICLKEDILHIGGTNVRMLFLRETWREKGGWGFHYYLIFYRAMRRFFSKNNLQVLIYLFENQAWEKMMCLAAESKNVKLIGVQHSTIPKYYLNFFLGKDEYKFMPLPDKILTTGNQSLNLLQQGGIPLNKICVGGAWRYQYLWKNIENLKANNLLMSTDEKLILVIFPIDPFIATSFYNFLNKLFFDYKDGKIKFLLKFHPHTPAEKLNINIENENIFQISDLSFNELLNKVNTVICSCTTGGLEALILGKKVIYYVPENLISVEPLEGIEHKCLFIINEDDGKDKLLKIINDKIELSDNYSFLQNYFDKINEQVWLNEISKST